MHSINSKRISIYPSNLRNPSAYSEDLESQLTIQAKNRDFCLANTYKMEPDHDNIFLVEMVRKKINGILQKAIGDMQYDAEKSKKLCVDLATEIKDEIKSHGFRRYKLISHVTISSSHGQGQREASRCVWNENYDRFVSCVYRNATMNVVAVLYAVYLE